MNIATVKRDDCRNPELTYPRRLAVQRWHRIFQPSRHEPLDFEATIERSLLELRGRFDVREVATTHISLLVWRNV